MTRRIHLIHLTVVGSDQAPATIEFGDRLTVIHGASDTGKSHVYELLQYSFGLAKKIEVPDEGKGYQYVHLGLRLDSSRAVTLIRDLTGGAIGVVDGDVRELMTAPAAEYLKAQHISKDPLSVSRYLLSQIDLDEHVVRRNQHNETRMLEWRDVMRLSMVDEEVIISKRSPIEFGQHTERAVEAAIFRLFIEGHDDSGLTPIPKAADLKRISANKLELLDEMIAKFEDDIAGSPEPDQLRNQLDRLNIAIRQSSATIEEASSRRNDAVLQRASNTNVLAELRERQDELGNLGTRFALLRAQYESDLARLEMLAQAADSLLTDAEGACPFCGAEPSHQHWPELDPQVVGSETFAASIASEQSKTEVLRVGLLQTIEAVEAERRDIGLRVRALIQDNDDLDSQVRALDADIREPGMDLSPLLETRSRVERELDTYSRLGEFYTLRASTAQVDKPKTSAEVPIVAADLHQFDRVATEILQQWSFPGSAVHYSTVERDLLVDQRLRRVRGKGVRSILRALFNVSLAEYCLRRGYRHPGFIALDSPIVSYRQPGEPERTGEDETISTNVVDAFYAYLQNNFQGQSLILENKSPLSPLPVGSQEYFFAGQAKVGGRPGFYPQPTQTVN